MANGETDANFEARRLQIDNANLAAPPDDATPDQVQHGLNSIIRVVCPYKVLEKQKLFMRRKMRKPGDMTTRQYVNHLHRINFDELPMLPPFNQRQELHNDEILDIICYRLP